MKKLLLFGFIAVLMLSATGAQQVVSPFGTGEDSIRCLQNISLMQTSVQAGNFSGALGPWRAAFENCPASSINIYILGAQIFAHFLEQETDPARRQEYIDKIMMLYDRRMELFPDREPRATTITRKINRYLSLVGENANPAFIHEWLGEAIDEVGAAIPSVMFWHYTTASMALFLADNSKREQYIADYFRIMGYIEVAIAAAQEAGNQAEVDYLTSVLREGLTGHFISSGAGDCESISLLFADRMGMPENRTNPEFLNEVLNTLRRMNCQESELFFTASELLHAIEPTANSAHGLANRALSNGDLNAAIQFFTQAAELETDNVRASQMMMQVASIFNNQRNLPRARQAAQEASRYNPNNGAALIFIAQLYASSASNIFPDARRGLVFGAAIDLLERARSVDSGVAGEASRLIREYTLHLMDSETAFMMGIRAGERVHIPGWINVYTNVRLR